MMPAPICRPAELAPLLLLLSLLAPATAWCDVYKWTDEKGGTVISNIRPPEPEKLRNFQTVLKERAAPTPPAPAQPVAASSDQMLKDRVELLERQLRARQETPPVTVVLPATEYPPPAYNSNYDPGYYYPVVPGYAYATYPVRAALNRPRVAHHGHRHSVRGGSPPMAGASPPMVKR
jgi:hypothetical protein